MFDHVESFHRPTTIPEALRLLRNGHGRVRVVAGGTDIIVQADRSIRSLVDITRLGLNYIRRRGKAWVIGSTCTMTALERSPDIRALADGMVASAASACGSVQIRNMATVGGNLVNASPAADLAVVLLALDATAVVADQRGRRKVPLTELKSGTSLLVEVVIPDVPRGGHIGWSFQKLGRTQTDISLVNVAAGIGIARGRVEWARIALGAVAPAPIRAQAEKLLAGRKLDESLLEVVAHEVAQEISPITDIRACAEYRLEMSKVLVGRALRECAARAGCSL
jgi:CO/xanthine dehydrogenase FAD-binding subunit